MLPALRASFQSAVSSSARASSTALARHLRIAYGLQHKSKNQENFVGTRLTVHRSFFRFFLSKVGYSVGIDGVGEDFICELAHK